MAESPEYRCLLTQQGAATKALALNSQKDKSIEPSNDQYDKNGRRNLIAMTQLIKKVAGDCIKNASEHLRDATNWQHEGWSTPELAGFDFPREVAPE